MSLLQGSWLLVFSRKEQKMLNTTYHTKEAIKKAEQIASNKIFDAGTTDQDKEAYMSLLILCDYDAGTEYWWKYCYSSTGRSMWD